MKKAIIVLALTAVAIALWFALRPVPTIVDGRYRAISGPEWMEVHGDSVRVGRGNSSFSILRNRASGRKIYDRNDLAKAHPQRLRIIDENRVEWTRDPSPPSPLYKIVFQRDSER